MYKKLNVIMMLSVFLFCNRLNATSFEDVAPKPDRCRQQKNLIVCASAASGMLMNYWSKQLLDGKNIYKKKGCDYSIVFRRKFGTADGRTTNWKEVKKAIEEVANDEQYLKISKDKISIESEACILHNEGHKDLLSHMKADEDTNKTRKDISPWDRPEVLVYIEDIDYNDAETSIFSHAVLAYGYSCENLSSRGYIVSLHVHDGRKLGEGRKMEVEFLFTANHDYAEGNFITRKYKKDKNRFIVIWPEKKCD